MFFKNMLQQLLKKINIERTIFAMDQTFCGFIRKIEKKYLEKTHSSKMFRKKIIYC